MKKSFLAPDLTVYNKPSYCGSLRLEPKAKLSVQFVINAQSLGLDKYTDINPKRLKFHTRSYLAQAGILFQPDIASISVAILEQLHAGKSTKIPGTIRNWGPCVRILKTDGNQNVGRFLYLNTADRITGKELPRVMKFGKAQHLAKDNFSIALDLSPGEEFLISDYEKIVVLDGSRTNWIKHTKKLPIALHKGAPKHAFALCVTKDIITLPDGYAGWIQEETSEPGVKHLKSQLLEPGTDWRVRVELYTKNATQRIPVSVFLQIFRVEGASPRTDKETFAEY